MIDQILKFYAEKKISDKAALAAIFMDYYGIKDEKQLAQKMNRSKRTIQRYFSELSILSPVSCTQTNKEQPLRTTIRDQIGEVLDKYGKLSLLNATLLQIERYHIEFDANALEYILVYCQKRRMQKMVRTFTPYFLSCIVSMWNEALVETAEQEESTVKESVTLIGEINNTPLPERPSTNQEAEQIWHQVSPQIAKLVSQTEFNMWFKQLIPVYKKESTLYLAVESSYSREWITRRFGNLLNTAFTSICMNFEIILDEDIKAS